MSDWIFNFLKKTSITTDADSGNPVYIKATDVPDFT